MESFNPYHSYNMQPDNVIYNKISPLVGQVGGGGDKLKEHLKQQPHLQNLVVAVQPSSATSPSVLPQGQPQNIRDWNSGLCGCCEDCCSCVYALFCHTCFLCTLAVRMEENNCGPYMFGKIFLVAMRAKLRGQHGIKGSIMKDIMTISCCEFCATHQMHRELNHVGCK